MKLLAKLHIPVFLIILIVSSFLISITWEGATSYDDGGLGTFALIVIIPILVLSKISNIPPLILAAIIVSLLVFIEVRLINFIRNAEK